MSVYCGFSLRWMPLNTSDDTSKLGPCYQKGMSWITAWIRSSISWWRHLIKTFPVLLALRTGNSPVTDEFPSQRPVTQSFEVFFNLRLNKRLCKQSRRWWFQTSWRSLSRHFPNVNGCTVEVWEEVSNFISHCSVKWNCLPLPKLQRCNRWRLGNGKLILSHTSLGM